MPPQVWAEVVCEVTSAAAAQASAAGGSIRTPARAPVAEITIAAAGGESARGGSALACGIVAEYEQVRAQLEAAINALDSVLLANGACLLPATVCGSGPSALPHELHTTYLAHYDQHVQTMEGYIGTSGVWSDQSVWHSWAGQVPARRR